MLADDEREKLLERQARVYELADVATKPAQWFLGGLKLLLLGVIVVALLVGTPFYLLFTGQRVGGGDVLTAFNALAALVLFFLCPYYVVVGGLLYFGGTAMWIHSYHPDWVDAPWFTLRGWFFVWVAIGYGWYFFKRWFTRRQDFQYQRSPYASNAAVEVCPPTTYKVLTEDSPLPDEVQQKLHEHLQSIIDECEAAVLKPREESIALIPDVADVHTMPLTEALRSTNAMFVATAARMKALVAESATWGAHTDRTQAARNIHEFLAMQQQAVDRMAAVLARLKCETAPYPIVELEETLQQVRVSRAQLQRIAMANGLL